MSLTLDEVFQVDLAVFILQVQTPARDLIDIRAVNRLPVTDDSVQARFGKLARPVTLVVFRFGEGLQEAYLEIFAWQAFSSIMDNPLSRRKAG
jgi:hypothetical protein